MTAALQKLNRYRTVVIDQTLAGYHFRLSVIGKPLRTKPYCCWASAVFKTQDKAEFEKKAGKALDQMARKLEGGLVVRNDTMNNVTLAGFPEVPMQSQVSMKLVDDKWVLNLETI